jgi:hypothetical protein
MPDSLWPERRGQNLLARRTVAELSRCIVEEGTRDFVPEEKPTKTGQKTIVKHNKHVVIGLKIQ